LITSIPHDPGVSDASHIHEKRFQFVTVDRKAKNQTTKSRQTNRQTQEHIQITI